MDKQIIEKMAVLGCGRTPQAHTQEECSQCPFNESNCMAKRQAKALVNAGYGDLRAFAEKLKNKAIRQQEFVGKLAIGDIEYVKVKDIDKTLNEFLGE